MKRSILVFLSFSKCRLKEMMSFAWIVCSLRLFHLLTTRSEKKCFLRSVLHLFFLIFAEWPLVLLLLSSWKNVPNGIAWCVHICWCVLYCLWYVHCYMHYCDCCCHYKAVKRAVAAWLCSYHICYVNHIKIQARSQGVEFAAVGCPPPLPLP